MLFFYLRKRDEKLLREYLILKILTILYYIIFSYFHDKNKKVVKIKDKSIYTG